MAWPVSGLGGPFGPFFLYSDYYVLVTVYVILGRDPRRWGLHTPDSICGVAADVLVPLPVCVVFLTCVRQRNLCVVTPPLNPQC